MRKEREEWAEQLEKWRIEQDRKARLHALEKSTEALESIISEWRRVRGIHEFFDELEAAIEHSSDEEKDLLQERLQSARELTRIPDVLRVLKAWKTPEEIYRETKRSD
jgi:GTP1/Obg family GTP-binding protein